MTEIGQLTGRQPDPTGEDALVDLGVSSRQVLELVVGIGARLALGGDVPARRELRTVGDLVDAFDEHVARPVAEDTDLRASVTRAERRLLRRGQK